MKGPSLTIGIEEEYQVVDPTTGELRSYITQILEEDHRVLREFDFKPKMSQSVIEIGTKVCRTAAEAGQELVKIRRSVADLSNQHGLEIIAAGTHPFSNLLGRQSTPAEPLAGDNFDREELAKQLLTFSTHIHIAIEDREFLIEAMNAARYLMPHVLALSTSSPFSMGRDTRLKSYRSAVLRGFTRTSVPRIFDSWADYTDLVDTLIKTNCLIDGRGIWWDVRPNWEYPTLEFRLCDVCTKVEEAVTIAAIFQAIIAKLWKLRYDNMNFRVYPADVIEENKWRAVRDGLDGMLIDFGKKKELPARELITELLDWFLEDVVDDLGSHSEVAYAHTIMENGTSADRQLATFNETGSLQAVVQQLIQETNDLPE